MNRRFSAVLGFVAGIGSAVVFNAVRLSFAPDSGHASNASKRVSGLGAPHIAVPHTPLLRTASQTVGAEHRAAPLNEGSEQITIPATALQFFPFSCLREHSGILDKHFASELGLSDDQIASVNDIASKTLRSLSQLEKARAEIKTYPNGDQSIFLAPFSEQDRERMESEMLNELQNVVEPGVARLIFYSAKENCKTFGRFGASAREVTVRQSGEGTGTQYHLEHKYFDENGRLSSTGSSLIKDPEQFANRYGGLFSESDEGDGAD